MLHEQKRCAFLAIVFVSALSHNQTEREGERKKEREQERERERELFESKNV